MTAHTAGRAAPPGWSPWVVSWTYWRLDARSDRASNRNAAASSRSLSRTVSGTWSMSITLGRLIELPDDRSGKVEIGQHRLVVGLSVVVPRRAGVEQAVTAMGGTLEAMYFAFGDDDDYAIVDLPDNVSGGRRQPGNGARWRRAAQDRRAPDGRRPGRGGETGPRIPGPRRPLTKHRTPGPPSVGAAARHADSVADSAARWGVAVPRHGVAHVVAGDVEGAHAPSAASDVARVRRRLRARPRGRPRGGVGCTGRVECTIRESASSSVTPAASRR